MEKPETFHRPAVAPALRRPPRRWRRPAALVFMVVALARPIGAAEAQSAPFRLGFSYAMFTDVNENDARASIRGLAATISRERHIPADPDPLLLSGSDAIANALRNNRLDAVALAADEYWLVTREAGAVSDRCLVGVQQGDPADRYVVLVRKDRGFRSVSDLAGKKLTVLENYRLRLGFVWLEVLLAQKDLAPAAVHFRTVSHSPKLSKVVLDVFFGSADAALVTQRGFDAMVELNPQIGQQVSPLVLSSAYIASLFAFRSSMSPPDLDPLLREFSELHRTPAGQQALTIFQNGQVRECSADKLADTLALIDEYARLRPGQAGRFLEAVRHGPQEPWNKLGAQ